MMGDEGPALPSVTAEQLALVLGVGVQDVGRVTVFRSVAPPRSLRAVGVQQTLGAAVVVAGPVEDMGSHGVDSHQGSAYLMLGRTHPGRAMEVCPAQRTHAPLIDAFPSFSQHLSVRLPSLIPGPGAGPVMPGDDHSDLSSGP
jgi:hypothetical protein